MNNFADAKKVFGAAGYESTDDATRHTWQSAERRADRELVDESLPSGVEAPPMGPACIVVDHFDLTMIDMNITGARLLVRPLSRSEAMELMHRYKAPIVATNDRNMTTIEQQLGIDPQPRPKVSIGTRLIVMVFHKWNDIQWRLVEYESDGDGCIG